MTSEAYLIWSNEHGGWWGPGRCGYVRRVEDAGCYSYAHALQICMEAMAGRTGSDPLPEIPVRLEDVQAMLERHKRIYNGHDPEPPAFDGEDEPAAEPPAQGERTAGKSKLVYCGAGGVAHTVSIVRVAFRYRLPDGSWSAWQDGDGAAFEGGLVPFEVRPAAVVPQGDLPECPHCGGLLEIIKHSAAGEKT